MTLKYFLELNEEDYNERASSFPFQSAHSRNHLSAASGSSQILKASLVYVLNKL